MKRTLTGFAFGLIFTGFLSPTHGQTKGAAVVSGLAQGETVEPWRPIHVAGPDRGTTACPVCTYLDKPAVIIFARDNDDLVELTRRMEALVKAHQARSLKGFIVVVDGTPDRLAKVAKSAGVSRSALCYPRPSDPRRRLALVQDQPESGQHDPGLQGLHGRRSVRESRPPRLRQGRGGRGQTGAIKKVGRGGATESSNSTAPPGRHISTTEC